MQNNNKDLARAHGSMAFFHFLQERPTERFSRFEAYCFMLDKACANYRPKNIDAKWIPAIEAGQFFITKTELANAWHWHRATVRWFLRKLTEFGHLSVEEHLKGMLCTMHHLIIPLNPCMAVTYNFDAMAKYAMYSYARGTHDAVKTAIVCGQIERSASFMLDGNQLTPYAQRELENVRKTLIHYAIESILAHRPYKLTVSDSLQYNETMVVNRFYEFFSEYLDGNWSALLTLMTDLTEVAFDAVIQSITAGRIERTEIWKVLLQETERLHNPPVDKDDGDMTASQTDESAPEDAAPTEASPSSTIDSSSDTDVQTTENPTAGDSESETTSASSRTDKPSQS